jgi:hypothetical protein
MTSDLCQTRGWTAALSASRRRRRRIAAALLCGRCHGQRNCRR